MHAKLFNGIRVKPLARNFLAAAAAIFLIAPLQANAKVLAQCCANKATCALTFSCGTITRQTASGASLIYDSRL